MIVIYVEQGRVFNLFRSRRCAAAPLARVLQHLLISRADYRVGRNRIPRSQNLVKVSRVCAVAVDQALSVG